MRYDIIDIRRARDNGVKQGVRDMLGVIGAVLTFFVGFVLLVGVLAITAVI